MIDKPEVILSATEEVFNDLNKFTDPAIARELLRLFEYRMLEENNLLQEEQKYASYDNEYDFIRGELSALPALIEKLNYQRGKMIQEINFLYYATSVGYYVEVENLLMDYVKRLEAIGESEETIVHEVNRKASTHEFVKYERGEKVVTEYEREHPDKAFLKFDPSNKIDYFDFYNTQVARFKASISRFFTDKLYKHRLKSVISEEEKGFNKYGLDEIEGIFKDGKYSEFLKICDGFLTPLITNGKLIRDSIIEKEDSKYEWKGLTIGDKTATINVKTIVVESLGHFIETLNAKGYLKKGTIPKKLARIFLAFFKSKIKSPKSLAQEIKHHERLVPYFSHIK